MYLNYIAFMDTGDLYHNDYISQSTYSLNVSNKQLFKADFRSKFSLYVHIYTQVGAFWALLPRPGHLPLASGLKDPPQSGTLRGGEKAGEGLELGAMKFHEQRRGPSAYSRKD